MIILTAHAKEQMIKRKIIYVWVYETIKSPDIVKHNFHKTYAIKRLNGKVLKVVYIKDNNIKIITTYFLK